MAAAFLAGCPSENPLLLEPPRSADSMLVYALAALPDGGTCKWIVGDSLRFQLSSGERSQWWLGWADSLSVQLERGGEVTLRQRVRLVRRTVHCLVLASLGGRDTLEVFLAPLEAIPPGYAGVRLINAVADTTLRYELRIGCPNSPQRGSPLAFLQKSPPMLVPAGQELAITVLEYGVRSRSLGTWKLLPAGGRLYTIVLYGTPSALRIGIDEGTAAAGWLSAPQPLGEVRSAVRVVNLSSWELRVQKLPEGIELGAALQPMAVGGYAEFPVCIAEGGDTLEIQPSAGEPIRLVAALEPLRRYSLVVMDSAGVLRAILLPHQSASGAQLQCVHAAAQLGRVRITLGAVGTGALQVGRVLAEELGYGGAAPATSVPTGLLPLVLQSAALPSAMLSSMLVPVDAGHSLLCLLPAPSEMRAALVKESAQGQPIEELPEGLPVQLLQAIPGEPLRLSLQPVLEDVPIAYRTTVTTVLPREGGALQLGAARWSVRGAADSVYLFVLAGTAQQPELFRAAAPRLWSGELVAQRRFLNASDVPAIDIFVDTLVAGERREQPLISGLQRGQGTPFQTIPAEYRFGLRIRSAGDGTLLARLDNVLLPLGRRYSLIFVGSRAAGYSMVVHQEL